ncbi:hypothetical protein DUNSADRAFT_2642 [Dunaliella salina]|uniref:Encoded protein n=1 Tax=Dunaliella salina TaxID=3046 RepID=A0ABQ7FW17_DUNSA|nr:hypothetical protein DUNSADRAFT_2642 [Dunaliella salina]|eukprot:KAF5826575.1 hypothetical protein DUNSADRAFT_2642 [Dunaliella salina]
MNAVGVYQEMLATCEDRIRICEETIDHCWTTRQWCEWLSWKRLRSSSLQTKRMLMEMLRYFDSFLDQTEGAVHSEPPSPTADPPSSPDSVQAEDNTCEGSFGSSEGNSLTQPLLGGILPSKEAERGTRVRGSGTFPMLSFRMF